MSKLTYSIGQDMLSKVIRYKHLVNLGLALNTVLKFNFERTSDFNSTKAETAPESFFYNVISVGENATETVSRIIQVNLYELNNFSCGGQDLETTTSQIEGDLMVSPGFEIAGILHQDKDGKWLDEPLEETDLSSPVMKYQYSSYVKFDEYLTTRKQELAAYKAEFGTQTGFRVSDEARNACIASGLKSEAVGSHFRKYAISSPLIVKKIEE